MRFFQIAVALVFLSIPMLLSRADDQPAKERPKEDKKVSDEEIKQLVDLLGDEDIIKRKRAKNRLEDIGEPAIPFLKKAVENTDNVELKNAAEAIIEAYEKKNPGLLRIFQGHGERVNGVAISHDGKRAVSACWDGVLRYWNVECGEMIREMTGNRQRLNSVALSNGGKRALTGGWDKVMRLWDLETGKEIRSFEMLPQGLWDLAFSPDDKSALSGCNDGIARLWDLQTGKKLLELETHKGGRAWTVAFTKDGKQAVTGGGDIFENMNQHSGSLRLWDLKDGKEIRQFKGHTADIRRVAISPDGKKLLSASFDGTMRLWELNDGKELKKFEGPGNFVEAVCFTPDGQKALCSYGPRGPAAVSEPDAGCSPRLWDLTSGNELKQFRGHLGPVLSIAISGDGMTFISGSADNTMRLWKLPK
jgi:WD40 repeat protein